MLVDAGDLDALSGNPPPWVNADLESGTSREEWKGTAEANKILGREDRPIPVESNCVRVGVLRCHSAGVHHSAFTVGDQLLRGAAEPLRRMLRTCRGVVIRPNRQDANQNPPATETGRGALVYASFVHLFM